jgi:hypothetical protein
MNARLLFVLIIFGMSLFFSNIDSAFNNNEMSFSAFCAKNKNHEQAFKAFLKTLIQIQSFSVNKRLNKQEEILLLLQIHSNILSIFEIDNQFSTKIVQILMRLLDRGFRIRKIPAKNKFISNDLRRFLIF